MCFPCISGYVDSKKVYNFDAFVTGFCHFYLYIYKYIKLNIKQVKHHKVPRLFVGTKKWQSVRRQNGSGSAEIYRENASAVNMEPDGSLKLRVED